MINSTEVQKQLTQNQERIDYAQSVVKSIKEKLNETKPVKAK